MSASGVNAQDRVKRRPVVLIAASGHIDPLFNQENLWHSFFAVFLSGFHSVGAALCAAVNDKHPSWTGIDDMSKSTLWMFPIYSKCTSLGGYSHLMSTSIFFGLTFSYLAVAYIFMKTALHIIFEYKVKLVFREQLVVAALLLSCALLNMLFMTHGGLALMEAIESLMTGVTMPLICLLEMVALLYVYRSRDFTSDINVAMEDSACSSRISIQWQIVPFFTLATLIVKCVSLFDTEIPRKSMLLATVPLGCILISLPLRALRNVYVYLHPETGARGG
ncbi:unnamed protein product [Arctia plantaginis]|uniref:Uncharacterized protein n=1 Tax=Arctia plantaginis TaxID=874455 RepID=A0A8S0ZY38_ARCPL|nr:unnamed protein product [Arctia plantaginis]CAB3248325.1 unnamed protein product [Arctia plantaginis]